MLQNPGFRKPLRDSAPVRDGQLEISSGRRVGRGSLKADSWNDAADVLSASARWARWDVRCTIRTGSSPPTTSSDTGWTPLNLHRLRVLRETSPERMDTLRDREGDQENPTHRQSGSWRDGYREVPCSKDGATVLRRPSGRSRSKDDSCRVPRHRPGDTRMCEKRCRRLRTCSWIPNLMDHESRTTRASTQSYSSAAARPRFARPKSKRMRLAAEMHPGPAIKIGTRSPSNARLNSKPGFAPRKNPFWACTFAIAPIMITISEAAENRDRNPNSNPAPPKNSPIPTR